VSRRGPQARVERRRHRGSGGQAVVVVALAGVALMTIAGLAIDGGYEAGRYRQAQNGADAGALAGARVIYENNGTLSGSSACSTATTAVQKNVPTATCTAKSYTAYGPAGPAGFHGYGALATVDAEQNVTVALSVYDLKSHVGLNEATGDTIASPGYKASGSVDLASLQASDTLLGLPVASGNATLFGCSSSATGPGTSQRVPSPGTTCAQSSLALTLGGLINVNTSLNLSVTPNPGLLQESASSRVPTSGFPQQRGLSRIVSVVNSQNHVSVNTNDGTTTTTVGALGGSTTGVRSTSSLADISATIAGTAITVKALQVTAQATYNPRSGFQTSSSCVLASATGSAVLKVGTADITINSDCTYTPITIAGVLTVGPKITGPTCVTDAYGTKCSIDVCALDITVASASLLSGILSTEVCLGKATAISDFTPVTKTAGVVTTGEIDTNTFFMRVAGTMLTQPTATAGAVPRQITDVSTAVFAGSPNAVNYYATQQSGGAGYCSANSYGPLVPGCNYVVYGNTVDDNPWADQKLSCAAGSKCWHGQLTSSSYHAVSDGTDSSKYVTPASGTGSGPSTYVSGGKYVLLPVISPYGWVMQYGLFQSTGTTGVYTLVVDPTTSTSAPLAQSQSTGDWISSAEGAVATKLVDPSYFTTAGWS
jgi:hypothetical protein